MESFQSAVEKVKFFSNRLHVARECGTDDLETPDFSINSSTQNQSLIPIHDMDEAVPFLPNVYIG